MASRGSLNKVLLIGNLTRDPELRYTPSGAAVCTFGLATNRVYNAADGTRKDEAEFHRIVSWNKLAELCSQLLTKGRKIYVEGRLQTRSWTTPAGDNRQTTEIVIDDMKILDKRPQEELGEIAESLPVAEPGEAAATEGPSVPGPEAAQESTAPSKSQEAEVATEPKKSVKKGAKQKTESREVKDQEAKENQTSQEEESTEDLIKDLPF